MKKFLFALSLVAAFTASAAEYLISDFSSTRPPTDLSGGDGSWATDYSTAGGSLVVGGNGLATSRGQVICSFSETNLASHVFTDSRARFVLDWDRETYSSIKLSLIDTNSKSITWELPAYGSLLIVPLAWPPGYGVGVLPSTNNGVNWSAINRIMIQGGGSFSTNQLSCRFKSLKLFTP